MRIAGIIVLLLLWSGVASATVIHVCTDKVQLDDAERAQHVDMIRRTLTNVVAGAKSIDVSIVKLAVVIAADKVTITAEIAAVISTSDNQLRTFGSGTATFTLARRQYRPERLAALRGQVLADALEGLTRRMRATDRRVA